MWSWGTPKRCNIGHKACCMKSIGGEPLTLVPPFNVKFTTFSFTFSDPSVVVELDDLVSTAVVRGRRRAQGREDWSKRVMAPAVWVSAMKYVFLLTCWPGHKRSSSTPKHQFTNPSEYQYHHHPVPIYRHIYIYRERERDWECETCVINVCYIYLNKSSMSCIRVIMVIRVIRIISSRRKLSPVLF